MPKRKPTENLPLFADMADAEQLRGFKTKDEINYEREQKRRKKRKHVPLAKAPASGPACFRCVHWRPPVDGDEFGHCRHLVMIVEDAPIFGVLSKTITDRGAAQKEWRVQFDYLRTGEAFTCSAYKHAVDVEAA